MAKFGSYNRQRSDSPVTITGHPHSDHAYSSTRLLDDDLPSPSSSSSIDEEYDFGSDADDVESDFQSDMEWNSDDKDEVDGDIPSPRRIKPNVKDTPPSSASKNKKPSTHETDDDEQKKIHEGASALLNLAGLFVNNNNNNNNNNNRNSVNSAKEEKEKNGVKKVKAKKTKIAMKADKAGVKKKVAKKNLEKQEKKKASLKRSGSKRKNAGSNGKYDNDQFTTTYKVSKISDNLKKAGVNKSPKSVVEDGVEKMSNSNKLKSKGSGIKKGSEKTKLKLSKSFGAANKTNRASVNNNDSSDGDKFRHLNKAGAKVKKKTAHKKASKIGVVQKKRKINKESSPREKVTSKGNDIYKSTDLTTNNNNNNDIDYKLADVKTLKYDDNSYVKERSESMLKYQNDSCLNESPLPFEVKKEIISPAGDAPLVSKASVISQAQDHDESEESSDDESDASKFLQKIGLMATSSPSVSPSVSLHKSPHFTRFSKKKAALS